MHRGAEMSILKAANRMVLYHRSLDYAYIKQIINFWIVLNSYVLNFNMSACLPPLTGLPFLTPGEKHGANARPACSHHPRRPWRNPIL
jgi:hypothetical protein